MTSIIHFVSIHKMFGLEIFDYNQNTKSHFIQIGQLQDIIFASVKFHQNGFLLILLYSNLHKTNFTSLLELNNLFNFGRFMLRKF